LEDPRVGRELNVGREGRKGELEPTRALEI